MRFFLFFFALFFSCTNSEKPNDVATAPAKDSIKPPLDTFSIGNKFFVAEQSTKTDFDKLPEPFKPDTSEAVNLLRDSNDVTRLGAMLIMKTGKGNVSFKDNPSEGYEEFAKYTYMGFLSDINSYVIFGSFMESFNYLLIDKTTADTNYACSFPILSPDKNYFICGNVDLIAAFVVNGFDLYEVKNKKIKLVARREQGVWGPEKIKWLDNSSLLVERTILDTTVSTMTRTDYVKLLMK